MRTTSAIGGIAFAIFAMILIVSGSSMYESAYGSASSISVKDYSVEYLPSGVVVNATVHARNPGEFPVNLNFSGIEKVLNGGADKFFGILIKVNMDNPSVLGLPLHNVTYFAGLTVKAVSYLISDLEYVNLTAIHLLSIFGLFTASTSNSTGTNLLTVAFKYLESVNLSSLNVSLGNKQIARIGLPTNVSDGQIVILTTRVPSNVQPGMTIGFNSGAYSWNAEVSSSAS